MSTPRRISEAVDLARRGVGFQVSEDPGRLNVSAVMDAEALAAWARVADAPPDWLRLRFVDEAHDDVGPLDVPVGSTLRFTATFHVVRGAPCLFTPEGWRSLLTDDAAMSDATSVSLAFADDGFDTYGLRVRPWTEAPTLVDDRPPAADATSPRRQVRARTGSALPPDRIEPWVETNATASVDVAAVLWREHAGRSVARSLPNELYADGIDVRVRLSGQPPRDVPFGSLGNDPGGFAKLQEAARWVYLEGADVEVRHTFLSSELARGWADDVPFLDGLPRRLGPALESARLLYRAHLRAGGKDTLKALADLRKSLSDETQKIVQQARDLAASVWRDVALAVGVVGLRVATDTLKSPGPSIGFAAVYVAVCLYVVVSFAMSVRTHRAYLRIVRESFRTWRTKLYGFLDEGDWVALAARPVEEAIRTYRSTERGSLAALIVVAAGLVVVAALETRGTGLATALRGYGSWSIEAVRQAVRIVSG